MKIQPLAATRRLLTWLSMYPANVSATRRKKSAYICHTLAVLIISLVSITISSANCVKRISINFDGAVFAFMVTIAEFGMIYFMIITILQRHQIDCIFTDLSIIYKNSE